MQAKQLSVADAKAEVQRLNSIQIKSKDLIDGLKVFDNVLEVKTAIQTIYSGLDNLKFKIPAMQSLEAKNPGLNLQKELDAQMNTIEASRRELTVLQNKQDKSKEDKEKEMALPNIIAAAEKREGELSSMVVREQELIAQDRKAKFMFSDIAKEAFGSAISKDQAQGVGAARGQAENQTMEGFKGIKTPIAKLANEFVDIYSFVNQWQIRQEALKNNASELEMAQQNTTSRRRDMVEERLMKLNSNLYEAQNHLNKTQEKIAKFSSDLRDSIKILQKEFEVLDKAIVSAAKDPGKYKVLPEQKLRFMELNNLLGASRQLQKIVDGIKIREDKALAKAPLSLSSAVASPAASTVDQSKQASSSPSPAATNSPPILRATQAGYLHPPAPATAAPAATASQSPPASTPSPRRR